MVLRRCSGCSLKDRPNTATARFFWRRLLWLLGLSAGSLLSFRHCHLQSRSSVDMMRYSQVDLHDLWGHGLPRYLRYAAIQSLAISCCAWSMRKGERVSMEMRQDRRLTQREARRSITHVHPAATFSALPKFVPLCPGRGKMFPMRRVGVRRGPEEALVLQHRGGDGASHTPSSSISWRCSTRCAPTMAGVRAALKGQPPSQQAGE